MFVCASARHQKFNSIQSIGFRVRSQIGHNIWDSIPISDIILDKGLLLVRSTRIVSECEAVNDCYCKVRFVHISVVIKLAFFLSVVFG